MNHISNLLNTPSLTVKREEVKKHTILDPHATAVVNAVFALFFSICRGFDKQYQDPKRLTLEKTEWVKAFTDAGLNSLEKVGRGLKMCRQESPINTPTIGQFIKWCMPSAEELGIPPLEKAYDEACVNSHSCATEKKWSHPAVFHAWSMCHSYELATLPKHTTFPIFERNYDITVKMLIKGQPLKEIPIGIAHDKKSPLSRVPQEFKSCTSREAAMKAISQILGVKIDGSVNAK